MMLAMSRIVPWVWLALVVVPALGVAGCDPSAEGEAQLLCSTICKCTQAPLPGIQDQCVQECVGDDDVRNVPQVCAECIFTHADRCGSLMADCAPLCQRSEPPPEPNPGSPDAPLGGGN